MLGAVIALGNFDGLHLGHQAVVAEAARMARATSRPLIVATFSPHPVHYFQTDAEPFELTNLAQRAELFAGAGADGMLIFEFGAALANTSALSFIKDLLAQKFRASGVVTGNGFRFGKQICGDAPFLIKHCADFGFSVSFVEDISQAGEKISSTKIREALRAGRCLAAEKMLSRPFSVVGPVTFDCDHQNPILQIDGYVAPRPGRYLATCRLASGCMAPAVVDVLKGSAGAALRLQLLVGDVAFDHRPVEIAFVSDECGDSRLIAEVAGNSPLAAPALTTAASRAVSQLSHAASYRLRTTF